MKDRVDVRILQILLIAFARGFREDECGVCALFDPGRQISHNSLGVFCCCKTVELLVVLACILHERFCQRSVVDAKVLRPDVLERSIGVKCAADANTRVKSGAATLACIVQSQCTGAH